MSRRKRAPRAARMLGSLAAIVVNVVLWYIVHDLPRWDLSFIIARLYPRVLPAIELSLGASIVSNVLFLAFDPPWFRRLGRAATNLVSLYSMYVVYRVYPFDFGSAGANQVVRVLMLLGMIATGIGTIVELARLPFGRDD